MGILKRNVKGKAFSTEKQLIQLIQKPIVVHLLDSYNFSDRETNSLAKEYIYDTSMAFECSYKALYIKWLQQELTVRTRHWNRPPHSQSKQCQGW